MVGKIEDICVCKKGFNARIAVRKYPSKRWCPKRTNRKSAKSAVGKTWPTRRAPRIGCSMTEPDSSSQLVPPLRWAPGSKPSSSPSLCFVVVPPFLPKVAFFSTRRLRNFHSDGSEEGSPRVVTHGAPNTSFAGADSNADLILIDGGLRRSRRRSPPRPLRKAYSTDGSDMPRPGASVPKQAVMETERRNSSHSAADAVDSPQYSSDDDSISGSASTSSISVSITHESDAAWRCFSNTVLFEHILVQLDFPQIISMIRVCYCSWKLIPRTFPTLPQFSCLRVSMWPSFWYCCLRHKPWPLKLGSFRRFVNYGDNLERVEICGFICMESMLIR